MTALPKKICIVDYGVGNLHSLSKAVTQFTSEVAVTDEAEEIRKADALILPGVGAFAAGMQGLTLRNLVQTVKDFAASNKPVLGICLGAQILMDQGLEFGIHQGLGLLPGQVLPFPALPEAEKIPQVGWNEIYPNKTGVWNGTILQGLPKKPIVYFVHSYILKPDRAENILALANYGGYEFCAAVKKNNIYGTQFHPEKSGTIGLSIIKKFINLI